LASTAPRTARLASPAFLGLSPSANDSSWPRPDTNHTERKLFVMSSLNDHWVVFIRVWCTAKPVGGARIWLLTAFDTPNKILCMYIMYTMYVYIDSKQRYSILTATCISHLLFFNYLPIPWRDSISRPIVPVSSAAGGHNTTM
jgi:hypothetical protein